MHSSRWLTALSLWVSVASLSLPSGALAGPAKPNAKDRRAAMHARVAARTELPSGEKRQRKGSGPAQAGGVLEPSNPAKMPAPVSKNLGGAQKIPIKPGVSVGHPNEGSLKGALRVDASLACVRAVSVVPGVDAQWGLPVLVKMIERSAQEVAKRYPGSVLNVGDISLKEGGEIGGHHSHESGRDADIGFYVADAKGKPLDMRSFVKFDSALSSKSFPSAHFDVARNWLLVQHFLTDPEARVSHIFVAEPLRQSLLAYAKARGVSPLLLNRAAQVLMQPTQSLPHDDHFHVRISCPKSSGRDCAELAKVMKSSKSKSAKARRGGTPTLRTPSPNKIGRQDKAPAPVGAARIAAKDVKAQKPAGRSVAVPGRGGRLSGEAANDVASDSLLSRVKAVLPEVPALSSDAAVDARDEAEDAVDPVSD